MEKLNPEKTALVLVDLQKGILNLESKPHEASDVLANATSLVEAFRKINAFIVFVHVDFLDEKDELKVNAEVELPPKSEDDWSSFPSEFSVKPTDCVITKRHFGAFYGTELDLQLRRRGIDTIVLGGISTHVGVDTTAREAYQHNYHQFFVEDAMSATSKEAHEFPFKYIFPLMGQAVTTRDVIKSLDK